MFVTTFIDSKEKFEPISSAHTSSKYTGSSRNIYLLVLKIPDCFICRFLLNSTEARSLNNNNMVTKINNKQIKKQKDGVWRLSGNVGRTSCLN